MRKVGRFSNQEMIPCWSRPQAFGSDPNSKNLKELNVTEDQTTLHVFAEVDFTASCVLSKSLITADTLSWAPLIEPDKQQGKTLKRELTSIFKTFLPLSQFLIATERAAT